MNKPSRAKIINKLVNNWKGLSVLDCGSGNGRGALNLYLKYGLKPEQVTAIDAYDQGLQILKDRGVNTICLDMETDNLSDKLKQKFNIIICCEVFEHLKIKTEKIVIASFMDLLKKGGSLFLSFPEVVAYDKEVADNNKLKPHIRQPKQKVIEELLCDNFGLYLNIVANKQTRLLAFQDKK